MYSVVGKVSRQNLRTYRYTIPISVKPMHKRLLEPETRSDASKVQVAEV